MDPSDLSGTNKGEKLPRNQSSDDKVQIENETDVDDSKAEHTDNSGDGSVPNTPKGSDSETSWKDVESPIQNKDDNVPSKVSGNKRQQGQSLPTQASKKVRETKEESTPAPEKKQRVGGGRRRVKQKAYMSTGGNLTHTKRYQLAIERFKKKG